MILGVTGHRPDKIGGYSTPNPFHSYVMDEAEKALFELKPNVVISGAALGFDQMIMELCIRLEFEFIAAVPFIGQEMAWPKDSRDKYHELLSHAKSVEIVSPGGYAAWKMQVRNQWIVDNSDKMLACFDGSNGGTKNALDYAISKDKEIMRIDPRKAQ